MASATYAAHQMAKPKANMPYPSARRRTSAAPTKPKPIATARGGKLYRWLQVSSA